MAKSTAIDLAPSEKRWRQESDARTLSEADQIKRDPERLKGAASCAAEMAAKAQEEARAMKKIASKAPRSQPKASKAKKK